MTGAELPAVSDVPNRYRRYKCFFCYYPIPYVRNVRTERHWYSKGNDSWLSNLGGAAVQMAMPDFGIGDAVVWSR